MWTPADRALVGDFGSGQALTDDLFRLLEPVPRQSGPLFSDNQRHIHQLHRLSAQAAVKPEAAVGGGLEGQALRRLGQRGRSEADATTSIIATFCSGIPDCRAPPGSDCRATGYFAWEGCPACWGHLTICSKLHGKAHARTAYGSVARVGRFDALNPTLVRIMRCGHSPGVPGPACGSARRWRWPPRSLGGRRCASAARLR